MDIFDKFLYQAKAGAMFANEYPRYSKLGNMFVKEKGTPIFKAVITLIGNDSTDMLEEMVHEAYMSGELDTSYHEDFIKQLVKNLFKSYHDIFKHSKDVGKNVENLQDFVRFLRKGIGA